MLHNSDPVSASVIMDLEYQYKSVASNALTCLDLYITTNTVIDFDIRNELPEMVDAANDATVMTDPSSDLNRLWGIVTFITLQTQI